MVVVAVAAALGRGDWAGKAAVGGGAALVARQVVGAGVPKCEWGLAAAADAGGAGPRRYGCRRRGVRGSVHGRRGSLVAGALVAYPMSWGVLRKRCMLES